MAGHGVSSLAWSPKERVPSNRTVTEARLVRELLLSSIKEATPACLLTSLEVLLRDVLPSGVLVTRETIVQL